MLIKKNVSRSLNFLKQLINLAKNKNKKQAEIAIFALRDLFINDILKEGEKLFSFQKNPLILEKNQDELANFELVEAYCDHCVKEFYKEFVMNILFEFSKDDLEYFRKFALDVLTELLIK